MGQTFEDLEIWKRGCRLAVATYEVLADAKDWGLRDQMQRAAVSVPSNIAEGYERTPKDFIRFLVIAKGSCAELRTQTYIAERVKLLPPDQCKPLIDESKQLSRMIQALINNRKQSLIT
ncbi:four helix bundle protein [Neorhodopirellula lusitana]|uniref:Four helix bundle protein n=2 Tax=Neorhodopirellula lusitana TaxID=445327 RepID=A0ABY1QP14_9BACT|nr:four helix bundle protein [Neorhodopirellula lusitana]